MAVDIFLDVWSEVKELQGKVKLRQGLAFWIHARI